LRRRPCCRGAVSCVGPWRLVDWLERAQQRVMKSKRFNLVVIPACACPIYSYFTRARSLSLYPIPLRTNRTSKQPMDSDNRPSSGPKRHSQIPERDNSVPIHVEDPCLPAIHLRIHPITHEGAEAFTAHLPDIGSVLRKAVHTCWTLLYNDEAHLFPRNVRSITLYVRPMGGVAYTTGNWLDGENVEIHLSAEYVQRQSKERTREEIRGVLVHEMVHVWQNDGSACMKG